MSDIAVDGATATAATQTQTAGVYSSSTLDQDAFLTLFTTQLQYQDPMNPMESYEMAAQLAQFSTVQELSNLNAQMLQVQAYLASINNAQMLETIGKEVIGVSDQMQLTDGVTSTSSYALEEPCDVTVTIYDEHDAVVRTMALGTQEAGTYQVPWDGLNDAGEAVENGSYRVEVKATDEDGQEQDVETTVSGTVYAFRVEDGMPYLILDGPEGVALSIGSVQEVHNPPVEASSESLTEVSSAEDLLDQLTAENLLALGGVALALL